jgi:hypothetical protein
MNTIKWIPLCALLAACSSAQAPSEPIAVNAAVRLLGQNATAYGAVLVQVKDLEVTAGARHLTVKAGDAKLDLANANQAWLAGTVAIPVGVDQIHVSLQLDDFGGYEMATAAGYIDARSAPIQFDTPVQWLMARNMATIRLDVGTSLVAYRDDTRVLMPKLDVAY